MVKFCILTTQRSGSTWLCHLLNNHSRVKELGELFMEDRRGILREPSMIPFWKYREDHPRAGRLAQVWNYLDGLQRFSGQCEAIGFKLMYNHVSRAPRILGKLVWDRYRIIHLIRANYLDTMVSQALATKRGLFHFHSREEYRADEAEQITLDVAQLPQKLHEHEKRIQFTRRYLALLPVRSMTLTYETLCAAKERALESVLEFLAVPPEDRRQILQSDMRKLNQKAHAEVIANFAEVKTALRGTRFAHHLETPAAE